MPANVKGATPTSTSRETRAIPAKMEQHFQPPRAHRQFTRALRHTSGLSQTAPLRRKNCGCGRPAIVETAGETATRICHAVRRAFRRASIAFDKEAALMLL